MFFNCHTFSFFFLLLSVLQVNPGSKAALQGIREGDVITFMNDQSTDQVTNSQAHALLKEAGPTLRLGLKQLSSIFFRLLFGLLPTPSIHNQFNKNASSFHVIGLK